MSPLDQPEIPARLNPTHLNRRAFLTLMGASVAMANLTSCRNKLPAEEIIPYAVLPEDRIAGKPQFFTTTFPVSGFVQGLLVKSNEGHPTKIEGNPYHPASRGATGLFAQAKWLSDRDRTARYYSFADPKLESLSIAQKILLRMGPTNEAIVKVKPRQIRKLLTHLGKR